MQETVWAVSKEVTAETGVFAKKRKLGLISVESSDKEEDGDHDQDVLQR